MSYTDLYPWLNTGLNVLSTGANAYNGNIPGAIRGGLRIGGNIASMTGNPTVGSAFGAGGGLLNLGTGIASGNPLQAATGALTAGSGISGLLGGPTLGSLAGQGLSALASVPGVGGLASELGALGSAIGSAGALGSLPLAGAGLLLTAMFTDTSDISRMLGLEDPSYASQKHEFETAQSELGRNFRTLQKGADTFGKTYAPGEVGQGLMDATYGIRTHTDTTPPAPNDDNRPTQMGMGNALSVLQHGAGSYWPQTADLGSLPNVIGELENKNWASWLNLMDQAKQGGVDPTSALGPQYGRRAVGRWGRETLGDTGLVQNIFQPNDTYSDDLYEGVVDPLHSGDRGWSPGGQDTTQEAMDLSDALWQLSGATGVQDKLRDLFGHPNYEGNDWRVLLPNQLQSLGLTPGNYRSGLSGILRGLGASPDLLTQYGLDPNAGPVQYTAPVFDVINPATGLQGNDYNYSAGGM